MARRQPGRGRPPADEPKNASVEIKMTETMKNRLTSLTDNLSDWGRKLFEDKLEGRVVRIDEVGLDSYRAKFLTKAPAGPWEEAIEHAGDYVLSSDVARSLEVVDDDFIIQVIGESMESAGVFDGALLLMRPLVRHSPRRNEIALVQIVTSDGTYQSTIKHYHPGDPPKLTDGDGNEFFYPPDIKEVKAVAVARGIIGRL